MKIEYRKGDDLDQFISEIHTRVCVKLFSENVLFINMEPGDATRYQFVIMQNGFNHIVGKYGTAYNWLAPIGKSLWVHPTYLNGGISVKDPWATALLCEVLRRVCMANPPVFYNFETCKPYFLEDNK